MFVSVLSGAPVLKVEYAGQVIDAVLPGGLGVPQLYEVDLELGAVVVDELEVLEDGPGWQFNNIKIILVIFWVTFYFLGDFLGDFWLFFEAGSTTL